MIVRGVWGIGMVLFLVILCAIPVSVPVGDDITVPASKQTQSIQPLAANTIVIQQFPATGSTIQSIDFQFGIQQSANPGTVQVSLAAEQGGKWQLLNESRIAIADIVNGRTTTLPFSPPLNVVAGQSLRLTVQSDAEAATAVNWLTNPSYTVDRFALMVNGVPQMGTARFGVTYEPLHRRLFQLIGPVFQRITVTLNGFWRTVFIAASALFLATLLAVIWQQSREAAVLPVIDSNVDKAILDSADTSDAQVHRSGQEGQG